MPREAPDPIRLPEQVWRDPVVLNLCRAHDANGLLRLAKKYGNTSEAIGYWTGIDPGEISKRTSPNGSKAGSPITSLDRWQRIADALTMPDHARLVLGLAPRSGSRPALAKADGPALGSTPKAAGAPAAGLLDEVRAAVTAYRPSGSLPSGLPARGGVVGAAEVHRKYQAADYEGAARLLPGLLMRSEVALAGAGSGPQREAFTGAAHAYLAASKLASKAGDYDLAWVTGDRAATCARLADDPGLMAAAAYSVACGFVGRRDGLDDAERVAVLAAEDVAGLASKSGDVLSAQGALLLLAGLVAARQGRASDSSGYLADASAVAQKLGCDDNRLWTGFGPTNVAIHRVSAAVALDRPDTAVSVGEVIDTSGMPAVLVGRRSQVHLDLAWACAQKQQDSLAVLYLLEAERVAPQAVRVNVAARGLVGDLLGRERRAVTPGLRPLAARAGVGR